MRSMVGGVQAGAPFELIPAVVSSFGAWHPDFVSWSKRLIAQVVDAGPASGVGRATDSCKAALWRFACSLSVALQRGNFAMMLPSFGSALEPGAALDRLGNPLSEEPEFWRCAPFSALSWVSETL